MSILDLFPDRVVEMLPSRDAYMATLNHGYEAVTGCSGLWNESSLCTTGRHWLLTVATSKYTAYAVGGLIALRFVRPTLRLTLSGATWPVKRLSRVICEPLRRKTTHGSAKWMSIWTAASEGLFYGNGFALGDFFRWSVLPVKFASEASMVVFGAPGGGKSSGVVVPLCSMASRASRLILFDPSGEVTAIVAKAWRLKGLKVYLIDFWGAATTCINPLSFYDKTHPEFHSQLFALADGLIVRTGRESETFFNNSALSLQKALLIFIKLHLAEDQQNLPQILTLLRSSQEGLEKLYAAMGRSPDRVVKEVGLDMERQLTKAPRQYTAIVGTLLAQLAWLDDPVVAKGLSRNDIDIDDLRGTTLAGRKGCVVSIVFPDRFVKSHAPAARAVLEALTNALRTKPAESRVQVVLEDAAVFNNYNLITEGITRLRKVNLQVVPVYQTVGQPREIFGKDGANEILSAEVRVFIGVRDPATGELVSDMCGVQTREEDGKTIARKLIMPDEVTRLPPRTMIVFIKDLDPIKLQSRPYWERLSLRGKVDRNPYYHGREKGLPASYPLQVVYGLALRLVAEASVPKAQAAVLVSALALLGWWLW